MHGAALFRQIVLGLIDFYRRWVSPFTPPSCRFVPTCSAYAREAVENHGVVRGAWLFVKRFARCHPFGGSGYDPVPARREEVHLT
ncbi:MAG: membrane protein insertion efficiency factor YidD [Gemmatimonadetes bacterium]|nr:membrane protein insertion efficiency factor YidD [Gemmatimonadota bacterium]